jgi:DNA polymerase elongation subunit (family B)
MNIEFDRILYMDIETVSQYRTYDLVPEIVQKIWTKKTEKLDYFNSLPPNQLYQEKAAIFAEYGKIVCISVALYDKVKDEYRVKSFYSEEEKEILGSFIGFCNSLKKQYIFCGHNIKEFDVPFLCRRMLVNGFAIPKILDFQDKKPWEIEIYDTLQMWKFGDFKNYTSLETLTTIFDIPTPKDDIDGSMVGQVFWEEKNLKRIVNYCQQDVVALIQLICKLTQRELIPKEKINIVTHE